MATKKFLPNFPTIILQRNSIRGRTPVFNDLQAPHCNSPLVKRASLWLKDFFTKAHNLFDNNIMNEVKELDAGIFINNVSELGKDVPREFSGHKVSHRYTQEDFEGLK